MAITARYKAYLKSDKWKAKRKKVLQRDNYICQECKIQRAWQVHHDTYERIFHERLLDLRSVCGDCHKEIHNIKSKPVSIFGGIGKVWARVIG